MSRSNLRAAAPAIVSLCLAYSIHPAAADDLVTDAHAQRHEGLFVQFTPGIGLAATAAKLQDGTTVSLSGAGGTLGLQIGAALTEHWILAADLSGTSVFEPKLKMGDTDVKTVSDVSWSSGYLGASVAYYVMPLDLHVGGGIGVFRMALDVPNMDLQHSNLGGAVKLAVGKEWWVSDRWSLGVNLESMAGAVPDDSVSGNGWGFFSVDLAMTATYN
jgi:hypothetical protein